MQNDENASYESCTITVSGGMVKEFDTEGGTKAAVLCAQDFEVTVKSCMPAKSISFMQKTVFVHEGKIPVKIRPCGDLDLDSEFDILLKRKDGVKIGEEFVFDVITENMPSALWANKDWKEETIPAETGLIVRSKPLGYYQLSYQEDFDVVSVPVCITDPSVVVSKKYEQENAFAYLRQINQGNERRKAILESLGEEFLDMRLERLGGNPEEIFTEPPFIATIGGKQLWTNQ